MQHLTSLPSLVQSLIWPQIADELENAYRSEVWNPMYSHMREQKQGIRAARVELSSSSGKVGGLARRPHCCNVLKPDWCLDIGPDTDGGFVAGNRVSGLDHGNGCVCRVCTRCLRASSRSTSAPTRPTPGSAGASRNAQVHVPPMQLEQLAGNMLLTVADLSPVRRVHRKWSSSLAGAKLRRGYEPPHPVIVQHAAR